MMRARPAKPGWAWGTLRVYEFDFATDILWTRYFSHLFCLSVGYSVILFWPLGGLARKAFGALTRGCLLSYSRFTAFANFLQMASPMLPLGRNVGIWTNHRSGEVTTFSASLRSQSLSRVQNGKQHLFYRSKVRTQKAFIRRESQF